MIHDQATMDSIVKKFGASRPIKKFTCQYVPTGCVPAWSNKGKSLCDKPVELNAVYPPELLVSLRVRVGDDEDSILRQLNEIETTYIENLVDALTTAFQKDLDESKLRASFRGLKVSRIVPRTGDYDWFIHDIVSLVYLPEAN